MPQYKINFSFEGHRSYTVSAEDQDEAIEKAAAELEWDVDGLDYFTPEIDEEEDE